MGVVKNGIGDKGAQAFARALKRNPTLLKLDIGGNDFEDNGAQFFGQAQRTPSKFFRSAMICRSAGHCCPDDGERRPPPSLVLERAKALAEALEQSCSVLEMSVGVLNGMGGERAQALAGIAPFSNSTSVATTLNLPWVSRRIAHSPICSSLPMPSEIKGLWPLGRPWQRTTPSNVWISAVTLT